MAGRGLPARRAARAALLQPCRRSEQPDLRDLMQLSVTHETRYRYSSPVVLSQQLLHLTPRVLPWQSCSAHHIDVEPTANEMTEREDYYGNRTASLVIAVPHEELVVRAASTVSVEPRARAAAAAPKSSWEAVRARLSALDTPPLTEPAEFLFDSPHVERSRELADYAVKSFTARRAILEAATDLARRIHRDFKFDRTATSVSTPLKQVLRQRSGVCQDFAHLTLGCGRDFADVTPMRGVILGGGAQSLSVRVTASPAVEATIESQ